MSILNSSSRTCMTSTVGQWKFWRRGAGRVMREWVEVPLPNEADLGPRIMLTDLHREAVQDLRRNTAWISWKTNHRPAQISKISMMRRRRGSNRATCKQFSGSSLARPRHRAEVSVNFKMEAWFAIEVLYKPPNNEALTKIGLSSGRRLATKKIIDLYSEPPQWCTLQAHQATLTAQASMPCQQLSQLQPTTTKEARCCWAISIISKIRNYKNPRSVTTLQIRQIWPQLWNHMSLMRIGHSWSVMRGECVRSSRFSTWTRADLNSWRSPIYTSAMKVAIWGWLLRLRSKCRRKCKNTWLSVGFSCNSPRNLGGKLTNPLTLINIMNLIWISRNPNFQPMTSLGSSETIPKTQPKI